MDYIRAKAERVPVQGRYKVKDGRNLPQGISRGQQALRGLGLYHRFDCKELASTNAQNSNMVLMKKHGQEPEGLS